MFGAINKWLDGKKNLIGGIAGLCTTAGLFLNSLQDGFQLTDLKVLGIGFAASMVALGLGGKLQKVIEALNTLGK